MLAVDLRKFLAGLIEKGFRARLARYQELSL
jgi:hypothetical protein